MNRRLIGVVAALALLLAGCSEGGRRAEPSNRDEPRGALALRDLRVMRDEQTGALSVSLRMVEAWAPSMLAAGGPNRLDVLFDTDGDREEDAVARVVSVDGTLRAFLTASGAVEHEVLVVRPDARSVAFSVSRDSLLAETERVGVAALSLFRSEGSPCGDVCRDRFPEEGWISPIDVVGFVCTQVVGFSQTREWYRYFEEVADNDRWQLVWAPGARVQYWGDPEFGGWSHRIDSPCTVGSSDPDRVVLTISGGFQRDPSRWAHEIRDAIATLRSKYPGLQQILLQPVVGGPEGEVCSVDGEPVRASVNHPVIVRAIASVVGGDVRAGASPEVAACSDYLDAKGHLTSDAAVSLGRILAEYYAAIDGATGP
jgi:hypothetical protein